MNTKTPRTDAAAISQQSGALYDESCKLELELKFIASEERCCCPEGVGFHEYIKNLKKTLGKCKAYIQVNIGSRLDILTEIDSHFTATECEPFNKKYE